MPGVICKDQIKTAVFCPIQNTVIQSMHKNPRILFACIAYMGVQANRILGFLRGEQESVGDWMSECD